MRIQTCDKCGALWLDEPDKRDVDIRYVEISSGDYVDGIYLCKSCYDELFEFLKVQTKEAKDFRNLIDKKFEPRKKIGFK